MQQKTKLAFLIRQVQVVRPVSSVLCLNEHDPGVLYTGEKDERETGNWLSSKLDIREFILFRNAWFHGYHNMYAQLKTTTVL